MTEKVFREEHVNEQDVKRARENFVREFVATMGWDKNQLTESQLEQIQRQPGWRAAGMIKS